MPRLRSALSKLAFPLVSGVIATVLLLQAAVAFRLVRPPRSLSHLPPVRVLRENLRPQTLWPFIDYPMYSDPHFEGEAVTRLVADGTLADGSEVTIEPEDLGLTLWQFRRTFIPELQRGDRARLCQHAEAYQARHGRRVMRLRLEDRPLVLEGKGVKPGQPRVLKEVALEPVKDK